MKMNENAQMSSGNYGAKTLAGVPAALQGNGEAYYSRADMQRGAPEQAVQQSEVARQLQKLLDTSEELDCAIKKLVVRTEKVTRTEPPTTSDADEEAHQVCSTILGRDLSGINDRIRSSMALLQYTIQRIEL